MLELLNTRTTLHVVDLQIDFVPCTIRLSIIMVCCLRLNSSMFWYIYKDNHKRSKSSETNLRTCLCLIRCSFLVLRKPPGQFHLASLQPVDFAAFLSVCVAYNMKYGCPSTFFRAVQIAACSRTFLAKPLAGNREVPFSRY